jgi:hypothetical protein
MRVPRHGVALPFLLAACTTGPWHEPPAGLPLVWRDRDVHYGPDCVVIASSGSGAASVHALVGELASAIAAETGARPPLGLVLALDADDPLPIEPSAAWLDAVCDLHARATGTPPRRLDLPAPRTRDNRTVELDPALLPRLLGTAVPRDDETLGLPQVLRERAAFVAVVPTRACIEHVADAMFDAGLDAEDVSLLKRALIAPFRGRALAPMVDMFTRTLRAVLLAAWLPAVVRDDAEFDRVCARAGVQPGLVRGTGDASNGNTTEDTAPRAASHDARLHVAAPPAGHTIAAHATSFTHFVDVGRTQHERFAAAARAYGKSCVHVPVRGDLPSRDDAERLARALPADPQARVLVFGESLEQPALLVAAHAFWLAGRDAADATIIAADLGAITGVAALSRALTRERPLR